ncbi:hypothetical protein Enr13x_67420 [Stieleria neptunia]|uniref:Uncharacterized protein n=1 Tax=Stieleria neptunia TaxID=2527979 RepID=A0A518I157_9BACT|nr:hypothetical protein [Stieleria neptunia]QDV46833.1 hypothetical protein Enr13x_67420 [Stieleria neptunia]
MATTFAIHVTSGHIVAIDPLFIDYAVNPCGDAVSVVDLPDFQSATGIDKLIRLEMAALGSTRLRDILKTIGYIDLAPCDVGTYQFSLKDIRRVNDAPDADPTSHFLLDTGQFVVFDIDYLDGVLAYFDWKNAYAGSSVNRKLERQNSQLIANRDNVYTQIQSPGVNRGFEFVGDGEYTIDPASFKLVSDDAQSG